ncbi:succinate dehydrogenase, hydrophobic membrane anchor protein [Nitrogeniibacter mangrovi]|uniref:Succinate dehydrogenase hydrophobic membrane anchor subunit n=1 Tax=Nitrogeniibacter mangrovi TaxID=2016596 RepID=A0A6C1B2X8_9RHOO|nr:succinate dehydrogenase, hydrophobic membrane anchor protein [Nitrogeniibacter mangrovi]QID17733.1 succinate dehydrogenase, hydrophobic membrane anchor protein [Nitrogeniibacter mangrovi]
MVKRTVVGAHYGLRDWLGQRVTATLMALYTVLFAFKALALPEMNYEAWSGMFAGGFMRFATFLFFMSLFYHAWVGVRDIFMDYIKPVGVRLALHVVVMFLLVGYAGWAAQILWRL